ncbi:Uncharacterised protein [Bordetella pertussis]|nr:Uncharacterised protein [Bordetella pertussis]
MTRSLELTASSFRRPAWMNERDSLRVVKIRSSWPPTRSLSDGAPPL